MFKPVILVIISLFLSQYLVSQNEKLVIEGAIIVSNNDDPSPIAGTIRWNGSNFEGWNGANWVLLDFSSLDEQDGDSSNEIQDLSITSNILTITLNGNPTQIDLTAYLDNTDTQLTEIQVDAFVSNNGFLTTEQDGDEANELQSFNVSETGDTLFLSQSNWVIIPGISVAQPEMVTDIDGNEYSTTMIGSQTWLKENLRTTHFNDGSPITLAALNSEWSDACANDEPAYSWYDTSGTSYGNYSNQLFGALYNWYVTDSLDNGGKNVCPNGWHVPSEIEVGTLASHLGGFSIAGGKMKQIGLTYWHLQNIDATNSSDFNGIPAGKRERFGPFNQIGGSAYFWTSTRDLDNPGCEFFDLAASYILSGSDGFLSTPNSSKGEGLSIRCLKD